MWAGGPSTSGAQMQAIATTRLEIMTSELPMLAVTGEALEMAAEAEKADPGG